MGYESVKKNNSSWSRTHQSAKESQFAPRPFHPQPKPETEVTPQSEPYSREAYDIIASKLFAPPNPTVQKQPTPQPQAPELEPEQEEQQQELKDTIKLEAQGNPEQPKNNNQYLLNENTGIQTKLTIGEPGDKYEQEADNVARQVMSMNVTQPPVQRHNKQPKTEINTKPLSIVQRNFIARTQAAQQTRKQPVAQQELSSIVQRHFIARTPARNTIQKSGQSANQATSNLENQLNSKKGSGSPLDHQTRSFMESRFGSDFSSVRVHTDTTAVQMNKELGAQAFTHGSDIFYGAGKSPGQNELTAHELTHVVQQGGAKPISQQVQAKPQTKTPIDNKQVRLFPEPQILPAKQLPEITDSLTNKESTALHHKIENYNPEIPVQTKQLGTENVIQCRPLNISSVSPRIQGVFTWVIEKALGSRVVAILERAGNVLGKIIQDPVGFLGNLVAAIRNGFTKFQENIGTHLTNGLMGWLFGALSGSGLVLPSEFNAKGLLSITLQVLGLTYDNFRGRLARRIGDEKVNRLEQSYDFLQKMASGGLTEAWEEICQEVGDMKDMILGGIKDWVINTIITKAITKLISMFNPVGGLIEAAKAIYNTVMFFIERAQQIAALVDSIFNSIGKIVAGDTDSASNYIEQAMGRTIPVIISFLARLLGLGGISDRIKAVIQRIQAPINRALDKLEQKIADKAKALLDGNRGQNQAPRQGAATPVTPTSGTPTPQQNTSAPVNQNSSSTQNRQQTGSQGYSNGSKPVEVPFSMNGKSHTFIVVYTPTPSVEMASKRDRLSKKIGRSVAALIQQNPQPSEQIKDLKELGNKVKSFEKVLNAAAKSTPPAQVAPTDPSISDMISFMAAYGQKYQAADIDILTEVDASSNQINDLRKHSAYTWLASQGLAQALEARIVAQPQAFSVEKIKVIFEQIDKFKNEAAFQKKVSKAITSNRFWSPNDGFFFEITDLKSIADIKFFDVQVGTREIDVLTGQGVLIDQKYEVKVDKTDPSNPQLDKRLLKQVQEMRAAIGSTINGIKITSFEIHTAQPLSQDAITLLQTLNLDQHFKAPK